MEKEQQLFTYAQKQGIFQMEPQTQRDIRRDTREEEIASVCERERERESKPFFFTRFFKFLVCQIVICRLLMPICRIENQR